MAMLAAGYAAGMFPQVKREINENQLQLRWKYTARHKTHRDSTATTDDRVLCMADAAGRDT